MPIQYLKSSFRRIDERTIEFKMKNMEGSARVNVSPSIYFDGSEITSGSTISVKDGNFREVKQNMDLDILLGESITIRSNLESQINPGNHTIKVSIKVNWPLWTTFESEFKVRV